MNVTINPELGIMPNAGAALGGVGVNTAFDLVMVATDACPRDNLEHDYADIVPNGTI